MGLSFNQGSFQSMFPDADTSGGKVEYTAEGSNYRVYDPTWQDGALQIQIDHIRGGATDDHVYLTLTFDPTDGSLTGVSGKWQAGNEGYTIPKVVITAADLAMTGIGWAAAGATDGVSVVAAKVAKAAFTGFCKLFNGVSKFLVGLSDDGGRFYTSAVVCHTLNRACACVTVK